MTEPLRISVEIANQVSLGFSLSSRVPDHPYLRRVIDARVRPLVDLLRECRPYIDDYQGTLPPGDPSGTTLARIDAALRDAE